MQTGHNTQVNISFETKAKLKEIVRHYTDVRSKISMSFLLRALINEEYAKVFGK